MFVTGFGGILISKTSISLKVATCATKPSTREPMSICLTGLFLKIF